MSDDAKKIPTLRDFTKQKVINIIKIKGYTLRDALRDGLFG